MNLTLRYIRFVLRWRIYVLAVVATITVLAGWSVSRGVMASSLVKLFFGENPEYYAYRQLADQFGGNDLIVLAFEQADLFTKDGWERLTDAVSELEEHPDIRNVTSIVNANSIQGAEDTLLVEPYGESVQSNASPAAFAELKQNLLADTFLQGVLLGKDGRANAVLIELEPDDERPVEILPGMLDEFVATFVRHGFAASGLRFAGMIPDSVESTKQARFNIQRLLPYTLVVLILVVYLLFVQLWPVLLTTGVALVSIIWAFGFAVALDRQINLMMAMVPAVMLIICFSDIIHLCSAYLLELKAGLSKHEAIEQSAAEVGLACLYTSVTTFISFAALAFIPTPIFRHLGITLGVGVAVALLLAMTLVPIIFSFMEPPTQKISRASQKAGAIIDGISHACRRISMGHPLRTVLVFAAVTLVAGAGLYRFQIETSIPDRLSPNHPIRKAQQFIQEHFAGVNFVDLYLTATDERDFLDPQLLSKVRDYQRAIEAMPDVDRALSLVDLVGVLHDEMSTSPSNDFPDDGPLIAQYMLLFEMAGGDGLERMIDDERKVLRMSVRRPGTGFVGTARMGEEAIALAQNVFGDEVHVKPTGLTYLFGTWLGFIVAGQKRGLLFAFIMTTLMMIFITKWLSAGVVSMIPNSLPIVILGGMLGWLWDTIDSDTMLVGMVAIGIAVDDTIHVLTRLRLEHARSASLSQAFERTFDFAGRAIIKTSVILTLGFLPFATSDYFTTRMMGTLLPLTLFLALAADLLLLPALVQLGWLKIPKGTQEGEARVPASTPV